MTSTSYTITIKEHKLASHLEWFNTPWDWKVFCGETLLFSGTTHSEQSAYIFAGAAFSRISGEATEIEIKTVTAMS